MKNSTRGEIIYKILDFLEDSALSTTDFFIAMTRAGYGASFSRLEYEQSRLRRGRDSYHMQKEKKRHLQIYISKLKKSGLIEKNSSGSLKLTDDGLKKLKLLKRKKILNPKSYSRKPGERLTIVSYDIPTKYNKERDILREMLTQLGFKLIHKSVWIGKVCVPRQFIEALNLMDILKSVEVMEVTKTGSLREIS